MIMYCICPYVVETQHAMDVPEIVIDTKKYPKNDSFNLCSLCQVV